MKVGFKGVYIARTCFHDVDCLVKVWWGVSAVFVSLRKTHLIPTGLLLKCVGSSSSTGLKNCDLHVLLIAF